MNCLNFGLLANRPGKLTQKVNGLSQKVAKLKSKSISDIS